MARTKAEVRAFLDSKVGTIVPHPGYYDLRGQCVTLTKALMEFLGVPNPYKARGNAIDAGDTMLREGIAKPGKGWLTVVVNRDMGYIGGVHYGHIWVDLQGEANYESNGNRALYTTKNTRPLSQGQQFINLDQWITEGDMGLITKNDAVPMRVINSEVKGWDFASTHAGAQDQREVNAWAGQPWVKHIMQAWEEGAWYRALKAKQADFYNQYANVIGELSARPSREELQAALNKLGTAARDVEIANAKAVEEEKKAQEAAAKYAELLKQQEADKQAGDTFLRRIGQFFSKYFGGK